MRTIAGLRASDLDAVLEALGEHGVAERLGPVGVGPLAHHQHTGVLAERHRGVKRGHPGFGTWPAAAWLQAGDRLGHRRDVLPGRAAATTNQPDTELGDE